MHTNTSLCDFLGKKAVLKTHKNSQFSFARNLEKKIMKIHLNVSKKIKNKSLFCFAKLFGNYFCLWTKQNEQTQAYLFIRSTRPKSSLFWCQLGKKCCLSEFFFLITLFVHSSEINWKLMPFVPFEAREQMPWANYFPPTHAFTLMTPLSASCSRFLFPLLFLFAQKKRLIAKIVILFLPSSSDPYPPHAHIHKALIERPGPHI